MGMITDTILMDWLDLIDWLELFRTLHFSVEIAYEVDKYTVYTLRDRNPIEAYRGSTVREALTKAAQAPLPADHPLT